MILVDSSIWVQHFRRADPDLAALLNAARILIHPFVIGELALGDLAGSRTVILTELGSLPQLPTASHAEVMTLIDSESLFARGIGYVDVHLLASCRLRPGTSLWTLDRRLVAAAAAIGLPTHR